MPDWMERVAKNSGSVWTYGIITIAIVGILRYFIRWNKLSMEYKSNNGKSFSKREAIDLMVSLSAIDTNSEKKWRGFYNSLSQRELQDELDEHWKL